MGKNAMSRTLAVVARSFAAKVKGETTARMEAGALAYEYVVVLGGKSKDLAAKAKISTGKMSKHLTTGKALVIIADETDENRRAVVRCAHGDQGDKVALTEAIKALDAAGVVAAAFSEKEKDESDEKDEKDSDESDESQESAGSTTGALESLSTAALVKLIGDALEVLAVRDDGPEHVEALKSHGKFAALLGRNFAKMPVA